MTQETEKLLESLSLKVAEIKNEANRLAAEEERKKKLALERRKEKHASIFDLLLGIKEKYGSNIGIRGIDSDAATLSIQVYRNNFYLFIELPCVENAERYTISTGRKGGSQSFVDIEKAQEYIIELLAKELSKT